MVHIWLSHVPPPNTRVAYFESLVKGKNYWGKLVTYNWSKIQRPLLFGGINSNDEPILETRAKSFKYFWLYFGRYDEIEISFWDYLTSKVVESRKYKY